MVARPADVVEDRVLVVELLARRSLVHACLSTEARFATVCAIVGLLLHG
jgi:hypothetical protein